MANNSVLGERYPVPGLLVVGQFLAASAILALLTYLGFVLRADLATISFIYLLLVLLTALFCGFWYASLISLLAVACLDYFFVQPIFRFAISDLITGWRSWHFNPRLWSLAGCPGRS